MCAKRLIFCYCFFAIVQLNQSNSKFPNGSCTLGDFPCTSSDQCIPQRQWCDEQVDCKDNSDEVSCTDKRGDDAFNRQHRKRPGADTDDLKQDECDFRKILLPGLLSPECRCLRRDIVCRHLQLPQAPPIRDMFDFRYSNEVNLLDLGGNIFRHVTRSTFESLQGLRLRGLALQHCSVETLEPKTFDNILIWRLLGKLYLDGNLLEHLPAFVFNVLGNNLRLLSIGYNSIRTIDSDAFRLLHALIELDLQHNLIESLNPAWFTSMYNLTILNLKGNLLTRLSFHSWPMRSGGEVQGLMALSRLDTLSLANNRIAWIQDSSFDEATISESLINLDLSENSLRIISNTTFKGLSKLLVLTLNQNDLQVISNSAFIWLPNLTSLDLAGNQGLHAVDAKTFASLEQLTHVYFDTFEMCAHALHVKVCEPKGDGISTKENLIDSIILRTTVWIMAMIGLVGNLVVLLGRQFITMHTNIVDSLHIINLAVSDLLMSIYLFILGSVDLRYRGDYLLHDIEWRSSMLCTLSGFLNMLSGESSVLILSLITWDRFVNVTRPFPRNQLSLRFASFRLFFLWLLAIAISILPVIYPTRKYFSKEFYNANSVCLPLYIHNPYGKGWIYSMLIFVCVNLSALVFIAYAYMRMIRAIRDSTMACRCWRTSQQMQERDKVAQHLGIIVVTDCLCWVPVIVIKLATLAGLNFSKSHLNFVYASLAIYIMPINSALNPILYTFATPVFLKQMSKLWSCCRRKSLKRVDGHSGSDTAFSLSMGILGSHHKRVLTYRGTLTSHTSGSKSSWRKHSQAV